MCMHRLLNFHDGFSRRLWQDLYKSGARKAVIVDLAPLGCSPSARAANIIQPGECLPIGNELALAFNAGVKQLVDAFYFKLPDFNIVIAQSYDLVNSMINDKSSYGEFSLPALSFSRRRVLKKPILPSKMS